MDELDATTGPGDAVLTANGDRGLARRLQRLAGRGRLAAVAPGIYVPVERAREPELRIVAAGRWAPTAVVTGAAAARLTFWPTIAVETITLSGPVARVAVPGMSLRREHLPPELTAAAPPPFHVVTLTGMHRALVRTVRAALSQI